MQSVPIFTLLFLVALAIAQLQQNKPGFRLKPTLFTNNRVYAIQNQHTAQYLTAGKNGEPYRSPDNGEITVNKLWKVKAVNKEGFQLQPLNGKGNFSVLWKPIYIGYGNYLLQALGTDQCLEANMKKPVSTCSMGEENLYQQWFPTRIPIPTNANGGGDSEGKQAQKPEKE